MNTHVCECSLSNLENKILYNHPARFSASKFLKTENCGSFNNEPHSYLARRWTPHILRRKPDVHSHTSRTGIDSSKWTLLPKTPMPRCLKGNLATCSRNNDFPISWHLNDVDECCTIGEDVSGNLNVNLRSVENTCGSPVEFRQVLIPPIFLLSVGRSLVSSCRRYRGFRVNLQVIEYK